VDRLESKNKEKIRQIGLKMNFKERTEIGNLRTLTLLLDLG